MQKTKHNLHALSAMLMAFFFSGVGLTALAANPTWIEEYEFISPTEHYDYREAPETIAEGGRIYKKKGDIRYELLTEMPVYQMEKVEVGRQVTKPGQNTPNDELFPLEITVQEEGQDALLKRQSVQWTQRTEEGGTTKKARSIDYGVHTEPPEGASEITAEIDGQERSLQLKEMRQATAWAWLSNHVAEVTLFEGDGIALDTSSPEWQGNEAKVLELLHLDPLRYILKGARWVQSDNGGESRKAEFVLDRYVAQFVAIYQCEIEWPDKVFHDGVAMYSGSVDKQVETAKEYKVKAIVTYEAPPDPTPSPTNTPIATANPTASPAESPTATPQAPEVLEERSAVPVVVVGGVGVAATGGAVWYFAVYRKKQGDGAVK